MRDKTLNWRITSVELIKFWIMSYYSINLQEKSIYGNCTDRSCACTYRVDNIAHDFTRLSQEWIAWILCMRYCCLVSTWLCCLATSTERCVFAWPATLGPIHPSYSISGLSVLHCHSVSSLGGNHSSAAAAVAAAVVLPMPQSTWQTWRSSIGHHASLLSVKPVIDRQGPLCVWDRVEIVLKMAVS